MDGRLAGFGGKNPHPQWLRRLGGQRTKPDLRKAFGGPSLLPLKGKIGNIKRNLIGFWIFRIFAKNGPNE